MTDQEILKLKQQIKAEVMEELQQKPGPRLPKPWDKIKEIVSENLDVSPHKYYQITSAISIIIRQSLGLRRVADMTFDDLPKAKEITKEILDLMKGSLKTA